MTFTQFIKKHNVRVSCTRVRENPSNPEWKDADHWKCQLRMRRKSWTIYFSQGCGHNGVEPSVESILNCVQSDTSTIQDRSFEEWCSDLGYDTDSRKAERTYKACEKQAHRAEGFFAPDFEEFLACQEE